MTQSVNVQIGDIIKRWRKSAPRPLTRDVLADEVGCCVSTIRNLELGRDLKVLMMFRLEKAKPGLMSQIMSMQNRVRPHRVANGKANGKKKQ